MNHALLPQLRDRERDLLARFVEAYLKMKEQPFFFIKHNDGVFLQADDRKGLPDQVASLELDVPTGQFALEKLTELGLVEWTSDGRYCEPSVGAVVALGPGRPIITDADQIVNELRDLIRRWEMLKDTDEVHDLAEDLFDVLEDICDQLRRIADALEGAPGSYSEWQADFRRVSQDATELSGAAGVLRKLAVAGKAAPWLNAIYEIATKIAGALSSQTLTS